MKSCRFCERTESDRWYFKDICRSCRRKQLRDTPEKQEKRRNYEALKENKCCKICNSTESPRWFNQYSKCNSCYNKEYKIINKNKVLEQTKLWRKNNKEYVKQYKKDYNKKTKNNVYLEMKRHTQKLNAMPKWVNKDELKKVYKNCPEGYEVDHIHPLQGELICGLHVPWNLQYLTPSENVSKWNRFDGTYENKSWSKK